MRRIRQIRRSVASYEGSGAPPPEQAIAGSEDPQPDELRALEARVAHLEQLLEGLQDSVHRESERHDRLIAVLQTQIDPAAMSAAIAEDNRRRGL